MTNHWETREGGLMWRAVLSIVTIFGWLVFLVLWLFFLTSQLGFAQNVAVFLTSLLVLMAILLVTWVTWALKFPHPMPQQGPGYIPYPRYARLKSGVGGLSVIIWLTFLVIWLFFYAGDFSFYENMGIFLASVLVVAGVNWAVNLFIR
ncbi:MAG: hypothetical protein SA339_00790 [Methanomassiliicoccus sp.]|nr:hypothetical protein [Methanomassiliicoccus sp.]